MKNTMKKALALALAVLMMASLSVAAFAEGEAELTGGEVGGYTSPDSPKVQNKTLILKKELTAYNLDDPSADDQLYLCHYGGRCRRERHRCHL